MILLVMEEKLISAIEMHPYIYDKSSSLFRNKYLKDLETGVSGI